jgi:uncharacterized protein YbjQ (UPF0145 family)
MADDHPGAPATAGPATEGPATAGPAGARLERLRTGTAWGSLLSVSEFAAISGAGFDPVGHVLGAAVVHLGYVGRTGRCSGSASYTPRSDLASAGGGPFGALLRKAYGVRRLALSRAVEECRALGGDGIVGVTLAIKPFPAGGTEFVLQGTAVRARSAIRPAAPFSSHLSGQEFALLLQAGWVPTALVFGISLGSRHDDTRTRRQTRRNADRREVRGYTELVKDTRRDARDQLKRAVAEHRGDGVVVDEMTLHIGERECPAVEGQHDHIAEAAILGTSIISFGRRPAAGNPTPLVIMRLNPSAPAPADLLPARPSEPPAAAHSTEPEEPEPGAMPEGGRLDRYIAARAAKRASHSVLSFSDSSGSRKAGPED